MTGILAVYNDIEPTIEEEFNGWYNRQHLSERVSIAGFESGQRYRALDASHGYFAWYEAQDCRVFQSDAYLARLQDPTHWTRRVMPNFRNMVRSVMTRESRVGEGKTAFAATMSITPGAALDECREWLAGDGLGQIVDGISVVGGEFWQRHEPHQMGPTTESELRLGIDQSIDANIVLHLTGFDDLETIETTLRKGLQGLGANASGRMNRYQLILSL